VHNLYTEQVEPTLWWGDNLGGLGLPDDKIVWGYHPITFVVWLHDRMKGSSQTAKGVGDASTYGGKKPPSEIKDDAEATDGFLDYRFEVGDSQHRYGAQPLPSGNAVALDGPAEMWTPRVVGETVLFRGPVRFWSPAMSSTWDAGAGTDSVAEASADGSLFAWW